MIPPEPPAAVSEPDAQLGHHEASTSGEVILPSSPSRCQTRTSAETRSARDFRVPQPSNPEDLIGDSPPTGFGFPHSLEDGDLSVLDCDALTPSANQLDTVHPVSPLF